MIREGEASIATVEQLIKQYETDPKIQKEVKDILADGKAALNEFKTFVKKHDVDISLKDLPKYLTEAKKLGFIK